MKTIGVLGGIGPQATMEFERRLHHEAQRKIPAYRNRGYPPMVVSYLRGSPVVMDGDGRPREPLTPDPGLLEGARRLGAIADFLVITSNFTHTFQREIEQAAGRPVLSMIDLAIEELGARRWANVGVLGFGMPLIYTARLDALGIRHETLAPESREALDRAIWLVHEGRETEDDRSLARDAVAAMRARWVDGTLLGCTEIPLLLGEAARAPDLLDPLDLLAEAAVARALD